MATLGNTGTGGNPRNINGVWRGTHAFTMPDNSTVYSGWARLTDASPSEVFRFIITDTSGNIVAYSDTRTGITATGDYEFTGGTLGVQLNSGTQYHFMVGAASGAGASVMYPDSGTLGYVATVVSLTANPPTLSGFTPDGAVRPYHVWIDYTPAASGYSIEAQSTDTPVGGTNATLRYSRILQTQSANSDITGTNAALRYGRRLQAQSADSVITGVNSTLRYARRLQAQSADSGITGINAILRYARRLIAQSSNVVITGIDADLVYTPPGASYLLEAISTDTGITGSNAVLRFGRRLQAQSQDVVITGVNVILRKSYQLQAQFSGVVITGLSATLTRPRTLNAISTDVSVAAINAMLRKGYRLIATPTGVLIVGEDAALEYGGQGDPALLTIDLTDHFASGGLSQFFGGSTYGHE